MAEFTYEDLRAAIEGRFVGVRSSVRLSPLGGEFEKVFPPTYGVADSADTRYAVEKRHFRRGDAEPESVDAVVLDSVASQANRQELALLEEEDELRLPVIRVDFEGTDAGFVGEVTSLEAPHRVFDAIFRDSIDPNADGGPKLFRLGEVGRAITEATTKDATAVYEYCPTALLFGAWDSTGPKGGRGSKYERAITTEVVALGVERGVKTSSRLDPLKAEKGAAKIYAAEGSDTEPNWTTNADDASRDGNSAREMGKGGDKGRPSQINHGNVTPTIDPKAGGVTAEAIIATSVLSFAQLRRLRFRTASDGTILGGDSRREVEVAGRAAIAALGLAAVVLATDDGYDLRSRCVLVADEAPAFELIGRNTSEITEFSLDRDEAIALVRDAVDAASALGLSWSEAPLVLRPTDRLVDLVARSRAHSEADSSGIDD